jgi:hypothetical protein
MCLNGHPAEIKTYTDPATFYLVYLIIRGFIQKIKDARTFAIGNTRPLILHLKVNQPFLR